MRYNFDEVADRYNTYSIKWQEAVELSEQNAKTKITDWSYTNPDVYIPMWVADMDFKCARPIVDAMHRTADHEIYGYSDNLSDSSDMYRQSVVDWYKKRFGIKVEKDWILYSPGSVAGINAAIRTFSNVGDGIIICRPVYGHFNLLIETELNRKAVDCHLINNDGYYTMDWESFEKKCADPFNKIFILCSPANPVGRVWTLEELQKIDEICKRNHVIIAADEIHCDIVRKGITHHPMLSVMKDYSNLILLSGINKTFNVAGLACANAIIPDPYLRANFEKGAGELMISSFAIAAQIAAYEEGEEWLEQALEYMDGTVAMCMDYIAEKLPKVKVCRPEGTYAMWLDFSGYGLTPDEIHDRIYNKAKVLLQDGLMHDPEQGGQFQRICIPAARCVVKEALRRIAEQF